MSNSEVLDFARIVDAKEPEEDPAIYNTIRMISPFRNYFILNNKILIVKFSSYKIKVSRLNKRPPPFWGVTKHCIDSLERFDYFLVLLGPENSGWAFSKREVKEKISTQQWKLAKDDQYKIIQKVDWPLVHTENFFSSPERFHEIIEE